MPASRPSPNCRPRASSLGRQLAMIRGGTWISRCSAPCGVAERRPRQLDDPGKMVKGWWRHGPGRRVKKVVGSWSTRPGQTARSKRFLHKCSLPLTGAGGRHGDTDLGVFAIDRKGGMTLMSLPRLRRSTRSSRRRRRPTGWRPACIERVAGISHAADTCFRPQKGHRGRPSCTGIAARYSRDGDTS